jgi:hypothetical protein
MLELERQQ